MARSRGVHLSNRLLRLERVRCHQRLNGQEQRTEGSLRGHVTGHGRSTPNCTPGVPVYLCTSLVCSGFCVGHLFGGV